MKEKPKIINMHVTRLELETLRLDFDRRWVAKISPDAVLASFHMKTPVDNHILQSRHARAALFLTYTFFTNRRIRHHFSAEEPNNY